MKKVIAIKTRNEHYDENIVSPISQSIRYLPDQEADEEQLDSATIDLPLLSQSDEEVENPDIDPEPVEDPDTVETELRFNNPEAGAERLKMIPEHIVKLLKVMPNELSIYAIISELRHRTDQMNKTDRTDIFNTYQTVDDAVALLHIRLHCCRSFVKSHFFNNTFYVDEDVPVELSNYLHENTFKDIIQLYIDIAQQIGYEARQIVQKLNNEEVDPLSKTYKVAQHGCYNSSNYYYALVDLYKQCFGRVHRKKQPQDKYQKRQSDYPKGLAENRGPVGTRGPAQRESSGRGRTMTRGSGRPRNLRRSRDYATEDNGEGNYNEETYSNPPVEEKPKQHVQQRQPQSRPVQTQQRSVQTQSRPVPVQTQQRSVQTQQRSVPVQTQSRQPYQQIPDQSHLQRDRRFQQQGQQNPNASNQYQTPRNQYQTQRNQYQPSSNQYRGSNQNRPQTQRNRFDSNDDY